MAQREFPPEVEVVQFMTKHVADGDERVLELMHLSQAALDHAHSNSAMLLHGALVELEGCSVLLAGPGGVGKSTACARLPAPWRTVCDDSTLVVCDRDNVHWAHPWPTWSDFLYGGAGGSWDVQTPVRLTAIFFLEQAAADHAESCGEAKAVCLLLEAAEQGSRLSLRGKSKTESRAQNLKRFEIICKLAKRIPCYSLSLSKSAPFWHEIERVLAGP
jgi:SynChlorMet cassette protein ScmC